MNSKHFKHNVRLEFALKLLEEDKTIRWKAALQWVECEKIPKDATDISTIVLMANGQLTLKVGYRKRKRLYEVEVDKTDDIEKFRKKYPAIFNVTGELIIY